MDSLGALLQAGQTQMEIEQDVFDTYNRRFREQHASMIWEHASIEYSFYTNDAGKCTLLWPWKILQMWQWTRHVNRADYRFD